MNVSLGIVVNGLETLVIRPCKDNGDIQWLFPGGKVEENETDMQAVIREVKEETGVSCLPRFKLGQRELGENNLILHYWICDLIGKNEIKIPSNEIAEARWVSGDEAVRLFVSDIFPPLKSFLLSGFKVVK